MTALSWIDGAMPLFLATPADLPAAAAFINAAYRGDSARQGWSHEADLLDGQRISADELAQDLRRPGSLLGLYRDTAESELLGCVWLEPKEGEAWYLGMLTVKPELQARQLGRGLLAAAEALAYARGARRMRMSVIGLRAPLIAWYERRGYALTGEVLPFPYDNEEVGRPRRRDLTLSVMEKALAAPVAAETAG
jgi:ribosomal protein S18 acetylase RimI-like enzyme